MQQVGLYLTPINYHLVGPEIAYILQDCEARVFIVHQRYVEVCRAAVEETGFPAENVFIVDGSRDGFRRYDELKAGQPITPPENRSLGAVMNYTSGTTGRPKGVRRGLPETSIEETDLGSALICKEMPPFQFVRRGKRANEQFTRFVGENCQSFKNPGARP